jgi:hypothetical protein
MKCPGQDRRFWRPEDLTDAPCPQCGEEVEFMKDDLSRICPKCRTRFGDPKKDMGCLEWCKYTEKCLGVGVDRSGPARE